MNDVAHVDETKGPVEAFTSRQLRLLLTQTNKRVEQAAWTHALKESPTTEHWLVTWLEIKRKLEALLQAVDNEAFQPGSAKAYHYVPMAERKQRSKK